MTNAFDKIVLRQHKFIKKLNKTVNNKSLQKCENFCKKDYMVEMDKVYTNNAKKYNIAYKPTKKDKEFMYNTCKKTFCNKKCDGYTIQNFKRNIKNGFQKTYKKNNIQKLKEKGALSGCVDIVDYNIHN
jgi:hypothetical protein